MMQNFYDHLENFVAFYDFPFSTHLSKELNLKESSVKASTKEES